MAGKRRLSSSLERRVQVYLNPRIYMMFVAEKTMLMRKEGEHGARLIEEHYEGLNPSHQRQLMDEYENKIQKNHMSKSIQITNQILYQWHTELINMDKGSVLGILLRGRIRDFYNDNGVRVESLMKKLKDLQAEFMEVDAKGMPIWEGEGDQRKTKMLPGKEVNEFNQRSLDLMNEKISIKI